MMIDMPRPRYQYVQREVSKHGTVAWYFRIGDGPRTRLKGEYGSQEFVACWKALMAGESVEVVPASKHTLQWLVEKYQKSAEWKALKLSTQRMRANILKRVCDTGGKLLISEVNRKVIAAGTAEEAHPLLRSLS